MDPSTSRLPARLAVLWLAGISLRITVLSVPPLVPIIHRDLHLDETMVGALTALPVVLLAVAAVPGSLLIARVGARHALTLGLLLVAVAGAARGLGSSAPVLFAATLVMGIGIAVSQPSLPTLVKRWAPHRTGLATAIYSNGFLIGEIVAASFTVPAILSLVGGSWQLVFPVWSILVLVAAVAVVVGTPRLRQEPGAPALDWWPDWRSAETWRLGFILGCASITYFGTNAFIPDFLRSIHQHNLTTPGLISLNLSQLPASLAVAAAPRVIGRRWPLLAAGAVIALSALFLLYPGGLWMITGAGLIGFSSGLVFVLGLALPPLLAGAHDVHRLSAAMFTIAYTCSFTGSLLGGALWDLTGVPLTAFAPVMAAGVAMIVLAGGLHLRLDVERGA